MLKSCSWLVRCLPRHGGSFLLLALWLVSCGRNDVKVYRVDKDEPAGSAPSAGQMPPGHPDVGAASSPAVTWTTPSGWQEQPPSQMRVGSFIVQGSGGQKADVSIIPLEGMAGGDLANVNRWRGQVGAAPLADDELKSLGQQVDVGGQPAELYDILGKNPGDGTATRILGLIQHRDMKAWFVKMTGDDALVEAQKPAFIEFLKSLRFGAPGMGALPPDHPPLGDMGVASAGAPSASEEGHPDWQVPPGWRVVAAGQFLVAKFAVSGDGDAQAAVNVSAAAGDGGGLVNNVNRWRKQLGLGELPPTELKGSMTALDLAGGQASLVELSGTDARSGKPARLVGAIVARGDQTWFYKLMGDDAVVQRERAAFTQFVQTAKY